MALGLGRGKGRRQGVVAAHQQGTTFPRHPHVAHSPTSPSVFPIRARPFLLHVSRLPVANYASVSDPGTAAQFEAPNVSAVSGLPARFHPHGGASAAAAAGSDVERFVAAMERLGLPSFAASDHDRGPMLAVIVCLLALRGLFGSNVGEGLHCSLEAKSRMHNMEFPIRVNGCCTQNCQSREKGEGSIPKVSRSPATSEPSSPISMPELSSISRHTRHNFHEVFHLRQGIYSDMPISKVLEIMKSTNLDNAPTQSLLSFVNAILDRIIENENGEIPYQNSLIRAREEKYKSRIRVLEALASGTGGQMQINSSAANGKINVSSSFHLKPIMMNRQFFYYTFILQINKSKIGERRLVDKDMSSLMAQKEDVARLTKDKEDMVRLLKDKEDIIRLMKEKEEMVLLIKEKDDMVTSRKEKIDGRDQSANAYANKSTTYNDETIRMIKEKEDSNITIMKLKSKLEAVKSLFEESHNQLESAKEEVLKLQKDKENSANIISKLRQELSLAHESYKTHIQELESSALQASKFFEHRIKEVDLMLEDSIKKRTDLEEVLKSRMDTWKKKEIMVNQVLRLQIQSIQDLRLSSVSIRHEIQNCQRRWSEELNGLGQSLNILINDSENYHAALEENRKLYNEIQELKGNIRVYCRIRPFIPGEDQKSTTIKYVGDNGDLIIANPTRHGKEGSKSFKFNKVFGPTTSQDDVFKDIEPLIRSVLDGYNVCIFAYGQTGSGKTYTMTGPENATENEWGVNYRALNDLFHISHNRGDTIMYEINVQMIEIYNEQIRDLLCSNGSEKKYPFPLHLLNSQTMSTLSTSGGHAKTLMFVQINPDVSSYSETLSTLKFAERVSGVELGASKANKEGKDIREFMEQLSLLKHKMAKKDDEINRLQQLKTQTPRVRTAKRADSPLKHSSSSPGISNLGSKIQHRRTVSSGKAMSIASRAGSDTFSDTSDRHSESGSMQSVDDILPRRGIMGLPKLSIGEMGQNSADPELVCFDYADSEERLSDISDSGLSMGTETDVSVSSIVELTRFQEQENIPSTLKEQESARKIPNDQL
ncbi:P-loop nucleoside triphosphate hydrolase superfamily protein with CH (Calponin Homology) domain [Zea mays]|uniref:p-loop nucleoside triphosphate hydrolase superfamily protein with CH (Calponin Homology) domain n=1 Tax=Zea mays TaxID=4577 RepID=A0A1D6LT48_MAIZE|nr:P-loop nucleoside triphosphate hydrolase superfamily protein with CH (Calponin Homology) domain [Zea mays]